MRPCGQKLKTKDGRSRGRCTRRLGHSRSGGSPGGHTNNLCPTCGNQHRLKNHGYCHECYNNHQREWRRLRNGGAPKNYQKPGELHTFPCGCTGILPQRGAANLLAKTSSKGAFMCRISIILLHSSARRGLAYRPVPLNTSHSVIRKMMAEPNCERCGEPLVWEFGLGKTPHLHHNHETGEPIGFTHPVCNPRAMEDEIDRLKAVVKKLKSRESTI